MEGLRREFLNKAHKLPTIEKIKDCKKSNWKLK